MRLEQICLILALLGMLSSLIGGIILFLITESGQPTKWYIGSILDIMGSLIGLTIALITYRKELRFMICGIDYVEKLQKEYKENQKYSRKTMLEFLLLCCEKKLINNLILKGLSIIMEYKTNRFDMLI